MDRHPHLGHNVQWRLLLAAALVLGAFVAWDVWSSRMRTEAGERERLLTQAEVIGSNLERQLDSVNRALESIRADLPFLQAMGDGGVNVRLRSFSDSMPGVRTINVLDACSPARDFGLFRS